MNKIKFLEKNQATFKKGTSTYFQSYDSIIAGMDVFNKITLDKKYWNYSPTTSKYRNIFTGLTTKETKIKIESGEIQLKDLNK